MPGRPAALHPADSDLADGSPRQGPLLAPQLAHWIVVAVFSLFCVVAALHILAAGPHRPRDVVLCIIYMTVLLLLQLLFFGSARARLHAPLTYAVLLTQAGLVYLPILQFKTGWVGMPGFFAGSVLLVLPPLLAVVVFGLVAASMGFALAAFGGSGYDIAYATVATVITGLVVYGLTRLAAMVTDLHEARTALAKMAVAQERLRVARDLHDLLGYSLSAIMLKSELAHRLVARNAARAQQELAEILGMCRQALADVRTVASGYRELSLDAESRSASAVLAAADIEAHIELDYADLPVRARTVLATVLREGVTNVLRHSNATRCDITVRQTAAEVSIDIVNDGVPLVSAAGDRPGSGLQNLSVRVAAQGGSLVAGPRADGRFYLQARVLMPVNGTGTSPPAPRPGDGHPKDAEPVDRRSGDLQRHRPLGVKATPPPWRSGWHRYGSAR